MIVRDTRLRRSMLFVLLLGIVLVLNLPVITMILNSFQPTEQIISSRSIVPESFSLDNYAYVSTRTKFWTFFRSSMVISTAATLGTIAAAAMAGYALSRFRSLVLTVYSRALLMVQMFPLILALIPLFIIFRNLHLINSYLSVILIYTVGNLSFATWMFKAFFDSIPRELEEAAQVDGCSKLQALAYVVFPLSGPGTAAVAIFTFLFSYNEFFIANVFLRDENRLTVPVGIQIFTQQYNTDWGSLLAASTLAMLPTLILFLFVQKYIMHGAIGSGVKG
jgi:ABC-type glycerol-3-phosphate transport system permease component